MGHMTTPSPIQVCHLRKVFGDNVAVSDLTLTVERGQVFGFLGPNGAGKTTAVKMLLGLIAPTSGEGYLFGRPLGDPRGRARVGFLPEHFRFHDWLKAAEFLQLHADLYRMPRDVARQRIPELLDLVGLKAHAGRKLRTFSKGMLQRVGLAQALLNEPELVFLDEPTSGLDPVGRRLVRDIIRELRERGTTVFLNSHLLSEVEITCDQVAFIKHGEVVHTSALHASGGALAEGELTVEIRARPRGGWETAADGRWEGIAAGLSRWSEHVRVDGERISLTLAGEADLPAINRYLVEHEVDVYALTPQRISLEDLFMRLVGSEEGL
jgi:ABC-2 type transport system ATP-binding protein